MSPQTSGFGVLFAGKVVVDSREERREGVMTRSLRTPRQHGAPQGWVLLAQTFFFFFFSERTSLGLLGVGRSKREAMDPEVRVTAKDGGAAEGAHGPSQGRPSAASRCFGFASLRLPFSGLERNLLFFWGAGGEGPLF